MWAGGGGGLGRLPRRRDIFSGLGQGGRSRQREQALAGRQAPKDLTSCPHLNSSGTTSKTGDLEQQGTSLPGAQFCHPGNGDPKTAHLGALLEDKGEPMRGPPRIACSRVTVSKSWSSPAHPGLREGVSGCRVLGAEGAG